MFWRRTAWLVLYIVLTAACDTRESDTDLEPPASITRGFLPDPAPLAGAVVVNDMNLPVVHWGDDSYNLEMGGAAPVIVGDMLVLTLSYSGGCAHHDFTLVADSRFQESDSVRLVLFLAHDANGDRCKAYPTESYRFDLAPVRTLYDQVYGSSEGVALTTSRCRGVRRRHRPGLWSDCCPCRSVRKTPTPGGRVSPSRTPCVWR